MTSKDDTNGTTVHAAEQAPELEAEREVLHNGAQRSTIGALQGFSRAEWAILKARAHELARPPEGEGERAADVVQVLTFRLGRERYALPVENVREVRPLTDLTSVPCTPDFVGGVMNLRGNILPLIDIRKLVNVEHEGITDLMSVIVVEISGMEVGIMADEVDEVMRLPLSELQAASTTVSGIGAEYIKGITADALALLNLDTVLGEDRIVVNEEVT